jgi:RNA 2',3'-cyclic 3'-phosphodiesterase
LSGTVESSDRLRLFCALDLPDSAIEPVVAWQGRELRGGRIVPPENLHLTLAFLGSRPATDVPAIAGALRSAVDGSELRLVLRGYRETRSVGMLTFEDVGGHAGRLATRLHAALEALGVYEPEAREWLPHLTVLRFRERPRLRPPLPELGEVVPSDAAVFISRLRPGGAVYESVEVVPLDKTAR